MVMLQVSKVKDSWFPPPLSTSAFLSWTLPTIPIYPDSPRLGPKCQDFPSPTHFQILGSGLALGGGRCESRQGAGLGPGLCRGRGKREEVRDTGHVDLKPGKLLGAAGKQGRWEWAPAHRPGTWRVEPRIPP